MKWQRSHIALKAEGKTNAEAYRMAHGWSAA
jgi:hypothetical protein